MTRYAQNGGLTRFDTGGSHSQNPNGGIDIGNNNSVEENETKQNNFIYSDRIVLDENVVSQYNLPKSLIGKSVADATKFIDNKFKGRNDKISQSTKNGMLSKIAEAQEAMKPQEPEIEQPQEGMEQQMSPEMMVDPSQMALGGYVNQMAMGGDPTVITKDMDDTLEYNPTNGITKNATLNAGIGMAASTLGNVGQEMFQENSKNLNYTPKEQMIQGAWEKGKDAVAAAVPIAGLFRGAEKLGKGLGQAIGGDRGGDIASGFLDPMQNVFSKDTNIGEKALSVLDPVVSGLIMAKKNAKRRTDNINKYSNRYNDQFSDTYAMGGEIDPPVNKVVAATGIGAIPKNSDPNFNTKQIVQYQPGVTSGKDGTSGFYLYNKKPTEAGFDYKINREFVRNENMAALQRTPQWQNYMRNKTSQGNQFDNGGPITGFGADGKWIKPQTPTYDSLTTPFSAPVGKDALIQYQLSKGLTKAQATGNYGPKTKAFVAEDILRNPVQETDPSKIITLPKETPFVEPTGVKAAFEKYADENATVQNKTFAGKSLDYLNKNAGNIARYAPIATNAYQLSQLKKPQGERLDRLSNRYKPEYVDEAQLQNIANQTMNNSVNAIGQSGASQGQLRSSIIGSQLQRTKALSDAYNSAASQNRATNDRAQTFNLGVDQVNLNQSNSEKDINARDQAAYRNAKREYITGIGEGIGDIGKEQTQKKIIAKTLGYKWDGTYVKDTDGNIVTDPDTGKPMTQDKLKELQSTKDKKALGGYLIKNKVK